MSNATIDDVRALLDQLVSRESTPRSDALLGEVCVALQDIVSLLERPDDDSASCAAIVAAIQSISFKAPDVHVNVPAANITVPPAVVTVMPAEASPIKGWLLTVKSRDANGAIREISFKPE